VKDTAASLTAATAGVDAAVASTVSVGGAAGSTFTLTTGVDSVVGTSANDTISATDTTLNLTDTVNGGAGADTLNVLVSVAAADVTVQTAVVSNVETLNIRSLSSDGVVSNAALVAAPSAATTINSDRSTEAVTVTGMAAGSTIGVIGDGVVSQTTTSFAYATAGTASIAISNGVKAGNITNTGASSASNTVTSTGAANTVGIIDLGTGTNATALTINASANLTASLAADFAATAVITVAGSAAKVDLSGAALSANIAKVDASGLTAGGVLVQVDQSNTTVDTQFIGGAGDDTLDVGKVVYNSTTLTAAGGAGTDTIKMSDQAALTSTTVKYITGFEVLSLTDDNDAALDTFDASLISGLTGITIAADTAADGYAVTNISATAAANVTFSGTQVVAPTLTLKDATTVGNLDTLSISINDGLTAKNTITLAELTSAGVETVNFSLTDNLTVTAITGLAAVNKITATGGGNLSLTSGALALNSNTFINASAVTGTVTVDLTNATANGASVTGSATKANTLTGSAQADVLIGGSANDTFTGLAGANVMTGGGGNDSFVIASTGAVPSASSFQTITDFSKTAGATFDTISAANLILGVQTAAAGAGVATITGGVATFNAADTTFAQHLAAVAAALQTTAGATAIWQEGADAYVYIADANLAVANTDVLVKLVGVTAGALTVAGNAITAIA
jgi:hypothetical protein